MICAKCHRESGDLYCGKCREDVRVVAEIAKPKDAKALIPLLAFDPTEGVYRFGCTVTGCPVNCRDGWCSIKVPECAFQNIRFHAFDGDNCVTQFCG